MNNCIYITGASSRARTTKAYLEFLYPDVKVRAFLVSPEMDDNPEIQDGIPVLPIETAERKTDIDTGSKVYLGTRSVNHEKLTSELMAAGFSRDRIIPVSVELDTELRNEYVKKQFGSQGKTFVKFDQLRATDSGKDCTACIYQACSAADSQLTDMYKPLKEEKTLQVGAAMTDIHLSDLCDNTGDNISDKNRQFCELTGLYWVWKNAGEQILGLVHYRRHFLLPENWVRVFVDNGVDVILPVPLYVAPNIEDNYKYRHVPTDWDLMLELLKSIHPSDYDNAKEFFRAGLYSPCNMFIAGKTVWDDLCEWMFPILFALSDKIGIREDSYQNRYPGFVSERLITYFFESRRDKYKVVYADKNFLK